MKIVKVKVLNSTNTLAKDSGLSKNDINAFIKLHNIKIFNVDSIHFSDTIMLLKHYNIKYALDDICLLKDKLYENTLNNTFERDNIVLGVVGHINHGKTYFISSMCGKNIYEKYAITQQICLYTCKYFDIVDTPGHEVFDAMRERIISIVNVFCLVISLTQGIEYETKKIIDMLHKYNMWHKVMFAFTKADIATHNVNNIINELQQLGVEVDKSKYVVSGINKDIGSVVNDIVRRLYNSKEDAEVEYDLICFNIEYINQQKHYVVKLFKSCLNNKTFLIMDHCIARIIKVYDIRYKPVVLAKAKGIFYVTLDADIKVGAYFVTQNLKIVDGQQKLIKYNMAMLTTQTATTHHGDDAKNIFFVKDYMTSEIIKGLLQENNIITQCRVLSYINASVIASFNKNDKIIFFNFSYQLDNKCCVDSENIYYIDNIYKILEFIQSQRNEVLNNKSVESVAEVIQVFKIRNMCIAGCKVLRGHFTMGDTVYVRSNDSTESILKSESDTIVSIKKNTVFIKKCKKNDIVGFILLKHKIFECKMYIYKVATTAIKHSRYRRR